MHDNYGILSNTIGFDVITTPNLNYTETRLDQLPVTDEPNLSLDGEIHKYILQKYPMYYHANITQPKKVKIEHMTKLFAELQDIGSQKDKHNLKWAFKKAHNDLGYNQLIKVQQTTDCFKAYDEVVLDVKEQSKKNIDTLSRKFELLSNGVSLIDLIISFFLIIGFSLFTQYGAQFSEVLVLGPLFLVFIALTKLSLDRFAIAPLINKYGWNLYNNTIALAREETIKLNATYCVLIESISRNEDISQRYSIISTQQKDLTASNNINFAKDLENTSNYVSM